jgi:hypothetical protein
MDQQSRSAGTVVRLAAGVLCAAWAGTACVGGPRPEAESVSRGQVAPPVTVKKWTGDLDGMVKRRMVRALVVFSRTQYFVDNGAQHGTAYELMRSMSCSCPSRATS